VKGKVGLTGLNHRLSDYKDCWAHVDINSYFATLIQQENPALRGQPVGIVKESGRTCIIAASKEAKLLGVSTGSRKDEALLLAPNIRLIPAQFDFYLDATKRLKRLFESLSPEVQIFSLDEAFINLTSCKYLYRDTHTFGTLVQTKIKQELGEWVTANVGISWNRFLAKIAGETGPKGSITSINQENLDYKLATTKFTDVSGVGYRLEKRLKAIGIENLYQIKLFSNQELEKHLGPFWSKQLRKMSFGEEPNLFEHIDSNPHMKSVGRSITGYKLCNNETEIKQILYNLVLETASKARSMGLAGRQISVYLSGEGRYWFSHVTLPSYVNQNKEVFELVYHYLYKKWQRSFLVIKFGVRLSLLKPETQINQPLWPTWHKQRYLEKAVDELAQKYGLFTVRPASLLNGQLIRPEVTGFLGDKSFQLGS